MKSQIKTCLLFFMLPVFCCGQRDLLKSADLVFQGEVLKLYTSTIDWDDPGDLGIVKVTNIIEGDELLRNYLQKNITVKFRNIKEVKPGQKAIFYTNLWLSGNGLAVTEIGRKDTDDGGMDKQREEIKAMRMQMQDDSLRENLRITDHVVTGRVLSVKKLALQNLKESEHDPVWTEAEVEVDESFKGDFKKGSRVKVTFAASNDIMWVRSPKFKTGQSGVWLLKKNQEEFQQVPNFIIADSSRFLDVRKRESVRRLIQ